MATTRKAALATVGRRSFKLNHQTGIASLVSGAKLPAGGTPKSLARLKEIRSSLPPRGEPNTIERRQGWRIVDSSWSKGGPEPEPDRRQPQRCIADVANEMVFTMGLPGAGKSTILKRLGIPATHVIIDPDEVKKSLPGYDPKNPMAVHEKSSEIAEKQYQAALRKGSGRYAVDGTGTNAEKMIRRIREAQRRGFYTRIVYVRVSLPTALKRNAARARTVPEFVVREKARDIETAADLIMREVQCFQQFDND